MPVHAIATPTSLLLSTGLLLVAVAPIHAAPLDFFGEDLNATNVLHPGNDDPDRLAVHPVSDAAYLGFLSNLANWQVDDLESYATGSKPSALHWADGTTGALDNGPIIADVPAGTYNGLYPTSGSKSAYKYQDAPNTWSILFSQPRKGFGFWATDVGDIKGKLTIQLTYADDSQRSVLLDTHSKSLAGSGSLLFFGTVDNDKLLKQVTFINSQPNKDGFGYDDFIIDVSAVPEPATLALGGLAAAAALLRKRRQAV